MQSMQLTLKRSLATLALLATVTGPDPATAAAEPGKPPSPSAPQAAPGEAVTTPAPGAPATRQDDAIMDRFQRRYGLGRSAMSTPDANPKRQKVETKLNEIILPEILFDGLPLSEVIKVLSVQAARLDPEKKGINFLINYNQAPSVVPTSIDPNTGLPVALPPAEAIDVNAVMVKFSLPLRNVSLKDTLEAVIRVAERPLAYSVEDYGVVVSAKVDRPVGQPPRPAFPEPLFAATFKVDTNTFLAGLENAFGITVSKVPPGQSRAQAREVQAALRALLTQLGVSSGDSKAVFYNDLTGIVMIRVTAEDQGIIQAAMETLGGTPAGSYGSGGGGFGMAMPGRY